MDSSNVSASVAVLEDEKILCEFFIDAGLTHSQTLMAMVESAIKLTEKTPNKIAVTVGPGSFTGVRIAVSGAKGLAFSQNIPCVAVSSMEALAYNCSEIDGEFIICALSDARNNRAYYALFSLKNRIIERISEDACDDFSEIEQKLSGNVLIVGDASEKFANAYPKYKNSVVVKSLQLIKGSSVAFASFEKEEMTASDIQPMYLQLPQAQREREARLANSK